MATAALTLKLDESKLGLFNRVPLSLYRQKGDERRFTPSAYALLGKIYNFSKTSNPDATCRLTYGQVREEFGFARSTVANAFEQLRSSKKIEKIDRDQDGTAYKATEECSGRQYDTIPQYLYTAEICVSGERRRLFLSEIRVLARLMTECAYAGNGGNAKTGGGVYRVSNKKLARILNLSETTVKKAILALMKAGLVYRSSKNKGINRYKLSGYEVSRDCYVYTKYIVKRKISAPKTSKDVESANARTDRERYYSIARESAERRAERYLAIANKDEKFRDVTKRLSLMELSIAKAELREPAKVDVLKAQKELLKAQRLKILKDMNLSEEMLVPRYACKCCSDTGFLPNGKACKCYDTGGGK